MQCEVEKNSMKLKNRDQIKYDAIAHLSDHLVAMSDRLQEI